MNDKQRKALDWLRRTDQRRMLYEGAGSNGKAGCGHYYIDYSDGNAPVLERVDIEQLVRLGHIERKWPDCEAYRASDKAGGSTP